LRPRPGNRTEGGFCQVGGTQFTCENALPSHATTDGPAYDYLHASFLHLQLSSFFYRTLTDGFGRVDGWAGERVILLDNERGTEITSICLLLDP